MKLVFDGIEVILTFSPDVTLATPLKKGFTGAKNPLFSLQNKSLNHFMDSINVLYFVIAILN